MARENVGYQSEATRTETIIKREVNRLRTRTPEVEKHTKFFLTPHTHNLCITPAYF